MPKLMWMLYYLTLQAFRKPDPGEHSSVENLEQTEIFVDQDTWFRK